MFKIDLSNKKEITKTIFDKNNIEYRVDVEDFVNRLCETLFEVDSNEDFDEFINSLEKNITNFKEYASYKFLLFLEDNDISFYYYDNKSIKLINHMFVYFKDYFEVKDVDFILKRNIDLIYYDFVLDYYVENKNKMKVEIVTSDILKDVYSKINIIKKIAKEYPIEIVEKCKNSNVDYRYFI